MYGSYLRHSFRKESSQFGFTLLELMIVMALLSILMASIVPVYAGAMTSMQIRSTRNDLVSTIHFIQEVAIQESREYRLFLDTGENAYWVERLAGLDSDGEKVFEPIEESYGMLTYLPSYLEMTRVKARKAKGSKLYFIACQPNGASDPATITFRDNRIRGRKAFQIIVKGPMGKVEVKE